MELLQVEDLRTYFETDLGLIKAVDGVSFDIHEGKTLGLVGESGSGKTMTCLSILRLLPRQARVVSGRIFLSGKDLMALTEKQMRSIRGKEIAMVFQEPMASLNPVFSIGFQIEEAINVHFDLSRREAKEKVFELLARVGIDEPRRRAKEYPHQLSGGMRQRAMIAMALASSPRVLLADEPTTAVDVTIQAQILELLKGLQEERGMGILLVTHDLGIVAELAQDVAVMYAGKIVEKAGVEELFSSPRHPYTISLFKSTPRYHLGDGGRLEAVSGQVPNPLRLPKGCRFQPRCPQHLPRCQEEEPSLKAGKDSHWTACHLV